MLILQTIFARCCRYKIKSRTEANHGLALSVEIFSYLRLTLSLIIYRVVAVKTSNATKLKFAIV
jgi:hypothetical protein